MVHFKCFAQKGFMHVQSKASSSCSARTKYLYQNSRTVGSVPARGLIYIVVYFAAVPGQVYNVCASFHSKFSSSKTLQLYE
jgi:hypothetical protein